MAIPNDFERGGRAAGGHRRYCERRRVGYNASISRSVEAHVRGILAALQLFAAFFLAILGLAMAFRSVDYGAMLVGAFLGGTGLTFLALLAVNLRK